MRLHSCIRRFAAAAVVASVLLMPAGASPAVADVAAQPAAACTGWSSNSTPPPTVRVLRVATGVVQTVDLLTYTKVVMAAEFNSTWPSETLRAGAVAVKEYAWYYTIHYRGGTKNGACYDVRDDSIDQDYWPETRFPAASQIQAVNSTANEYALRGGLIFLTGYRAGSSTTCGGQKDGYHLWQLSARGCGLLGHSAEYILHLYYDPITIRGAPVAPGPPINVVAQPFDTSAQVSWSAPASDGGAAISGYTVTSDPDGKTCATTVGLTCAVSGLANLTAYTFTVTATNRAGTGLASDASNPVTPAVIGGATYTPIPPVRLLDTRTGNGSSGSIAAYTPRTFQIAGLDVIPSDATAVTGNLTVTAQTSSFAVYLGPDPVASPTSSTINFVKGDNTANGVTVALSHAGSLSATYMSPAGNTTHLVFDVTGYFMANTAGQTYHSLRPARIVDSRDGLGISGKVQANNPTSFHLWLHGGVPDHATAVTGNVTAVNSTNGGALYVGPDPVTAPTTSTVNFKKGQIRANNLTVKLSDTGNLNVTLIAPTGSTTDLVFDVTGYYTADLSGGAYVAVTPARLLDSRTGNGLTGPLHGQVPATVPILGLACIPLSATAITGNVTVTGQTSSGAVFVGPDPETNPNSSTVNFVTGENRANGFTVAVSATGSVSATYLAPTDRTTQLVIDVTGYFRPAPSP